MAKNYDSNSLWTAVTREFPNAIAAEPHFDEMGSLSRVDITTSVRKQFVLIKLSSGNGSFARIAEDYAEFVRDHGMCSAS